MLVTPGKLKSNKYGAGNPACSRKGIIKLPRQQSTCMPILYFFAKFERPGISSMHPSGKLTAEPTIYSGA